MYKVFIDHKPIVFVSEDELCTRSQHIRYTKNLDLKTVKPLMKAVTLDEPLQISSTDPELTFHKFFDGYLKVPAAGGIVRNNGRYLLIKRNGLWDIPKGKIDKGEPTEDACIREIHEECGVSGHTIVAPLTETLHVMKYKGRRALKHTFWFILDHEGDEVPTPQPKEGITKAVWKSLEFMLGIRGKTYGSINQVIDSYSDYLSSDSDL